MSRSTALRAILRSTGSRSSTLTVARSSIACRRAASTRNPVPGASGPASPEEATRSNLAPGEEIDPQLQGYPQLPYVSNQLRPAKGWWDEQNRRNFGEVLHEEADMLSMFGPDVPQASALSAGTQILAAISVVGLLGYLTSYMMPRREAIPKEYPYNGLEKEYGGPDATWHPTAEQEVDDDEE